MAFGRGNTFTWLGHAGMEIRTAGGLTILVDPWFSNPRSPRTMDEQEACDVLLLTHGHFDHFDADTIALAQRTKPAIPCIHELSLHLIEELGEGADVTGMNKGGTVEARGVRVTMVPAQHSSGDVHGHESVQYFGEPVGFVIELEDAFRVYHSGDTTVFGDMALIRELYRPDLAMLSIGGHFTMDPPAAAIAVELLGVRDVIPVHWGTFPILTGTPAALRGALQVRGLGEVTVHEPEPGVAIA